MAKGLQRVCANTDPAGHLRSPLGFLASPMRPESKQELNLLTALTQTLSTGSWFLLLSWWGRHSASLKTSCVRTWYLLSNKATFHHSHPPGPQTQVLKIPRILFFLWLL